ncbi:MAG TPA: cyclase [Bacteroidetes bacterium]|nr:cyclase [Bacteroidota bacterium]
MKNLRILVVLVFLSAVAIGCQPQSNEVQDPFENGNWVDLTHEYSEETLVWPTSDNFALDTLFVGITDGGYYYESFSFRTNEHGGTHLDAPIHFAEGRMSTEELSLDQITGYAAVVDVSENALADRNYQVTVDDILKWESTTGQTVDGKIVLLYTGYSQFWSDAEAYMGTTLKGEEGVAALQFPGIHPELAQWLVDNRTIKAIGLDTPSLDFGRSTDYMAHRILFDKNIPGFENIANLDQILGKNAYIVALPMKIKNGSGAPLRIVAFVRD